MTNYLVRLLFLLVCTCGPALMTLRAQATQDDVGYTLEREENGVMVYVREETNGDMSVRIMTAAGTQVQRVLEVLDDAPRYPQWVHRCDGAYVVEGGTAENYVFVSGIDMPFPFRDKQVVARIEQELDGQGVLTRTITAEPGAIPQSDDRDRLTVYRGEWVVTPKPSGGVDLQCTVRTDAGAGLPNWLRKDILCGGPVKTMVNLRERLEAAP